MKWRRAIEAVLRKRILLSLLKGYLAVAIAFYSQAVIDSEILRYSRTIDSFIILHLLSAIVMLSYFYLIGCGWKLSALLGLFSSFALFGITLTYSLIFLRIIPQVYEMLFGVKPFDLDLNFQGIILGINITGIIYAIILHKYCFVIEKHNEAQKM